VRKRLFRIDQTKPVDPEKSECRRKTKINRRRPDLIRVKRRRKSDFSYFLSLA